VGQTLVGIYGGYFSAALGVGIIALLALLFDDTLQRLNALKALLQLVIGGVTALGFALLSPIEWVPVIIIGVTSLVGGEVGARLAQRVSDRVLAGGNRRLRGSPPPSGFSSGKSPVDKQAARP
jgi:uncharacterized membrane protein YfcA